MLRAMLILIPNVIYFILLNILICIRIFCIIYNLTTVLGGARGVMDLATRVQFLDETDCISHSTNTLGKGMNPIILPPAMGN